MSCIILLGPPVLSICKEAIDSTLECCFYLGVPIAVYKTEG